MSTTLKLLTCGSVDDGKSTLIGHLLYDAKLLFTDQEQTLELESEARTSNGSLDYSLLLDGLMAEREQGITIDVAYRYFSTRKRHFILADTPGHEQYTRNMAVGASFADLAILLIDVTKGLLTQTRRHLRICSFMGIRHFVFAINKMDLVNYQETPFRKIQEELREYLAHSSPLSYVFIPVCATNGDNLVSVSERMPWYPGPSLLEYLEEVDLSKSSAADNDANCSTSASTTYEGCLLPVQRVTRPVIGQNRDTASKDWEAVALDKEAVTLTSKVPAQEAQEVFFSGRGYQGQLVCGTLRCGDPVSVWPAGLPAKVRAILVSGKAADCAYNGQAVTVYLDRELDISRGCVIGTNADLCICNMLECMLLWMDEEPLIEGRSYWMQLGTQQKTVTIMKLKYKEDIDTGQKLYETMLHKNELACVELVSSDALVFTAFQELPALGRFVLIDKISHQTSGCGTVLHSLRRSENLTPHQMNITRQFRAASLRQEPKTYWFTGLSGSGKSTLANALETALAQNGKHTMLLDGDNIRLGLNKNLGFTEKDRIENIRRVAEVARLMNDAGLIVLVSFISPYEADRESARQIIGEDAFIEIYVSTPLQECERRDPKGLYKKARNGQIPNFTGINSPYEPPHHPDIIIDTSQQDLDAAVKLLEALLK